MIRAYLAGAAVNPYRFVVQSADNTVIQASAVTSVIIGVSGDIAVASGLMVDVSTLELTKIELGGTVTRGDMLTSDADGKGIELSSTILSAQSARCGAIALQSGVSGDIIDVCAVPQMVSMFENVTATANEVDTLAGAIGSAIITIGAEAANVINVGIQLKDADGADLAVRSTLYAYLSDDANGDSIVATAPDGGVAIGTDGLAVPLVANKAFMLTSESDGDIDLNITESGAKTEYLILITPNGKLVASTAITHT